MPYSVTKFKKEAVKMVNVKINTGGSAFRNEDETLDTNEIVRLLRQTAQKIENGYEDGKIMDINGNSVGTFKIGD
jgi:hypothetical protein